MSGKNKLFTGALASLDLGAGSRVVFMPGANRRDEGACIAEITGHPAP